jgi:hypothetical protein
MADRLSPKSLRCYPHAMFDGSGPGQVPLLRFRWLLAVDVSGLN